jgi:hypothetical protein
LTTNLQSYSSFEAGITFPPNIANGTASLDNTAYALQGTTAVKLTLTTTGSDAQVDFGPGSAIQASVTGNVSYAASYWVYTTAASAAAYIQVDWYTSGGSYLATLSGVSTALTQNAWTRIGTYGVSPSTATSAINNPTIVGTSPSGTSCWFDAGQVETGTTGTDWVPGPGEVAQQLGVPGNLHSTATASHTISLSWNAVTLATGYTVRVISAPTVPDRPIIGTATAAAGSASVSFSPAVWNGGATVLDYTATSSPGSFSTTGAPSPLSISGLTPGTSYTFTVKGRNIIGQSAASAPSNTVIPLSLPTGGTPGALSGLPWTSGALGSSPGEIDQWRNYRGEASDICCDYFPGNSWNNWDDPSGSGFWTKYAGWWNGKICISLPLLTDVDVSYYSNLIAGDYDQHFRNFGINQVAAGRATDPVRLGWEADGDWFAWGVANNAHGSVSDFQNGFRRAVTAIRQGNPQAVIDMTVGPAVLPAYYPGDAYVDIIGMDYYNMYEHLGDFNTVAAGPNGIWTGIAFARAHGKKFGHGEWGVVNQSPNGGGDNPSFIQGMWDTFYNNRDVLAYESYFNISGGYSLVNPNENPASSALYASLW